MVYRKSSDFVRLKWVFELSGFCAKTKIYFKHRRKTVGNPSFPFIILEFSAAGEKIRFSCFQRLFVTGLEQFSGDFLRDFEIFLTVRVKWFFVRFQNGRVFDLSGCST